MPLFKYRAAHASGRIQTGVMTAANENALAETLKTSGHELISARKHSTNEAHAHLHRLLEKNPTDVQITTLCGQIADLLRAGVPLISTIEQIKSINPHGKLFDALQAISQNITQGMSLAEAFAQHPDLFNSVFISALKAGEESGDLATTFIELHKHLRWQMRVSAQLRRALRYPLFLLLIAGATTCFMMTMVVPQIVDFLISTQTELPFITRLLISCSEIASVGFLPVLLVFAALFFLVPRLKKHSKKLAIAMDKALLSLPLVGNVIHQLSAARFTGSLSLLLKSGTSLPESIKIASDTLQNESLISAAQCAIQKIHEGDAMSKATAMIFSPFVTQMLIVGEQSGNLGKSLDDITRYYDETAKDTVDELIGTIEPLLTLIIGGLLAWVVLAVLGPIYGSIGNINRGAAL